MAGARHNPACGMNAARHLTGNISFSFISVSPRLRESSLIGCEGVDDAVAGWDSKVDAGGR